MVDVDGDDDDDGDDDEAKNHCFCQQSPESKLIPNNRCPRICPPFLGPILVPNLGPPLMAVMVLS